MKNPAYSLRNVTTSLLMALTIQLCLTSAVYATSNDTGKPAPQVQFTTSKGQFVLQLNPELAPETVDNFLRYVSDGFYSGTVFHRVIPGFMIQGGGFTPELSRKATAKPIENEASQALPNERGTVAMARTRDPDSATSQFFINLDDNDFLNAGVRGPGYAVFGRVTEGMDVVDAIAGVETGYARGMRDVPVEPVIIESARVLTNDE